MYEKKYYFLELLRKITENPKFTQRKLAKKLNFSLGKLNYCLKELKKKGILKIENFKKNKKKISYVYILTPKGIKTKSKLTLNFMKQKLKEYEDLKKDLNK